MAFVQHVDLRVPRSV